MESFPTTDGRVLEYLEVGDRGGRPVAFLHGTPATAGAAVLFDDAARRQRVRLFALSRPGYGATTMTAPGLVSVGHDVGELASGLGIGEFEVLGVSGGGPFALAVGATLEARARRVMVAASPAPYHLIAPEVLEGEDEEALALLAAGDVDGAVATLTAAVRQAFGAMCQLGASEFEAEFISTIPATEHYFDARPAERTTFIADFRRGLATFNGFVRDNLSWEGPWDFDLAAVEAPVALLYGAADPMVAHGEWLAARLPNGDLTIQPEVGHFDTCFGSAEWLLDPE